MRWLSPCLSVCLAITAIVGGATSFARAQPGPLTREAFAEQVLQRGLGARAIEAQTQVAAAERDAAGRWQNPSLAWERSAAVSGRRADETQDDLTLRLPMVLSGRLGLEREAAASSAASAELRGRWACAVLRHDARLAFDAVVAARARVAVLEEAAVEVEALTRTVAAREKAGESAGYERLRLEFEAALVADQRSAAILEQRRAESTAGGLLGASDAALPPFAGDLLADPAPALDAGAPATERPDVQALARTAEAAARSAEAARRRAVPEPVLTAGAQVLDVAESGRGAGYVIGLEVALPLFDSGARDAEVASAQARAAEAERLAQLHRAETLQAHARAAIQAKRARLATHREAVLGRAERLRELALTAWRAGGAEILTLVDAQRAAREAHLAALDLALDTRNAETDALLLMGIEK